MMPASRRRPVWTGVLLAISVLLTACAPGAPPQAGGEPTGTSSQAEGVPGRPKVLVASILSNVDAMAHVGNTTTSGGWQSYLEVYADGLTTSEDKTRKPTPRLAAALPTFDAGTIELVPDGRMKTTYRIRSGVTWHDGTPFTAQDLVFTQRVLSDRRLPSLDATGGAHLMEFSEATDPQRLPVGY